jgi:hypothetical protein
MPGSPLSFSDAERVPPRSAPQRRSAGRALAGRAPPLDVYVSDALTISADANCSAAETVVPR